MSRLINAFVMLKQKYTYTFIAIPDYIIIFKKKKDRYKRKDTKIKEHFSRLE